MRFNPFKLFNLFNPPCMVAIATAFREMGSAKWGWICVGFQFLLGYAIALCTYQIGALFIAVCAVVWYLLTQKNRGGGCSGNCAGCTQQCERRKE